MTELVIISDNNKKLADVYKVFKKWLFMTDTSVLDMILATYLSNQKVGTPVWLIIVAQSGDTKSELIRTLIGLPNIIFIDNMTVNSFVSGHEKGEDLFSQIVEKSVVIIIPDVAVLSSKTPNQKNEIWAQFRNLYDGFLSKRTGMKSKHSEDFHVTLIGGATPDFRSQYIINNHLGSRELLFSPIERSGYLNNKLNKAMENDNYEEQMRKELREILHTFLKNIKLKTININENENKELNDFLNEQVNRLRNLRATASIDYYSGTIKGEINIETPTRAKKQLKRIIEALLSLDENYDIEKAKNIVKRIVESSGNQLRMSIMNEFEKHPNIPYSISKLSEILRANKKSITIQLNFLWQLEWLNKFEIEEKVCGRLMLIPYFERKNTQ